MTSTNDHRVLWILTVVLVYIRGCDSLDSSKTEGSLNCSSVMDNVLEAAYDGVGWAVEMVDASCKPPIGLKRHGYRFAGLLIDQVPSGSLQFLGNYDQCLGVETTEDFGTLYCRIHVQVDKVGNKSFSPPKNVYADICAPDICEGNDLVPFARHYVKQIPGIAATVQDAKCLLRQIPLTYKAIAAICILSSLLVFVAMGTIYDVIVMQDILLIFKETSTTTTTTAATTTSTNNGFKGDKSQESDKEPIMKKVTPDPGVVGQLLLPFSLYTNIPDLLSTSMPTGSLPCINGMRFIATTWIIMGHCYMGEPAMENLLVFVSTSTRTLSYQLILIFQLAVDIFFVMSGLLVTYKTMREFRTKKPSLDYFKGFYFHRYLRLTPAYILVMVTYVSLFKYVSDGPFWPQGVVEINECEHSWWRNILYINNFSSFTDICMIWTWSLAIEMQFFIISPLVLLPLYYYDWRGLYVPILMLTSSVLISGGLSYNLHLMPVFELIEEAAEYWTYHYTNTSVRIAPYLVGMMTGYLLYKTDCEAKLSKGFVATGWALATVAAIGVFGAVYEHHNGHRLGNEMAALYNGLHRTLWGMSISWVIFACSSGYGGFVNGILSWKVFVPFTSIAYCTYLSQPAAINYFFLSQRRMFYVNGINLTYATIGVVVVSYGLAATAYLIFEVPFARLDKAIRRIKNKKSKPHQS